MKRVRSFERVGLALVLLGAAVGATACTAASGSPGPKGTVSTASNPNCPSLTPEQTPAGNTITDRMDRLALRAMQHVVEDCNAYFAADGNPGKMTPTFSQLANEPGETLFTVKDKTDAADSFYTMDVQVQTQTMGYDRTNILGIYIYESLNTKDKDGNPKTLNLKELMAGGNDRIGWEISLLSDIHVGEGPYNSMSQNGLASVVDVMNKGEMLYERAVNHVASNMLNN